MSQAAALLALDPAGLGGALLLGAPGPARELFLDSLRTCLPPAAPLRRLPPTTDPERLAGGLDLAATLAASRPIHHRGLLAEARPGALLLQGAERVPPALAAGLASAIDAGAAPAIVALDEREAADEATPAPLQDRLAFWLDPDEAEAELDGGESIADLDLDAARSRLAAVTVSEALVECLVRTAAALGIASLRAPLLAVRAARAAAALAGREEASEADVILAARLVLAPRATALPAPPQDAPPPPAPSEGEAEVSELPDRVLEAARAALPADVLATLAAGASRSKARGRAGANGRPAATGRPAGTRPGDPRRGYRLALFATLRAALPFQRLRQRTTRVEVRPSDLRVERRRPRTPTTTIFLVDASGSQAVGRLAEAKGAVQLLLAECYVRRDEVALIAFRGRSAELLLPPTRSLARARRLLAGLPGGGPTPLAAGLDAGLALAAVASRRGTTPSLILLTDGSANIARDGSPGRPAAERDALDAARRLRASGHRTLLVDSAVRPTPQARRLAGEMGARYLPLPFAAARVLSDVALSGPPGR